MSASLAAFLYLVSGALFIMALRGLSSPETSRQGNLYGMIGMGDCHRDDAAARSALRRARLAPHHRRHRHRRRHRRGDRQAHRHDGDAAARRRLPFARRPRRRLRGGCRLLCAGSLRHRDQWRDPRPEPHRNGARCRHRRAHLHRLDHRLPQARRADERQADHPAGPAHHQYRAGRGARRRSSMASSRARAPSISG